MKTTMRPEQVAQIKMMLAQRMSDPPHDTVTSKQLAVLDEARTYAAASSYNFLFSELMVIKHAVARGRLVTVEAGPSTTLDSVDAFMAWALVRYPAFAKPGVHDLNLDPVDLVWGDL